MQGTTKRRIKLAAGAVACASAVALAAPATGSALNTYVDQQTGNDANLCTLPTAPCATVAGLTGGVAKAGTNDTIFVDGGTYNGTVEIGDGKSLIAQEFVGAAEGMPVIDGQTMQGIDVQGGMGTISGFVLRGDIRVLGSSSAVTLDGNVIDEPSVGGAEMASVGLVGTGSTAFTITNNTFTDAPASSDEHIAVHATLTATDSLTVSDNSFNNYREAIDATGGSQVIAERNLITGIRQEATTPIAGFGIVVNDTVATLTANRIQQPGTNPGSGIYAMESPGAPNASLTSTRNQVYNFESGIQVIGFEGAVSLNGDVFANNTSYGVGASLLVPTLTATNLTAFGNGVNDISLLDTALQLNSSIVGNAIDAQGTSSCMIDFSRGPAITIGGNGCGEFDTTAAPGFANPTLNNFHLTPGSAMIDAGSNVLTPPGTLDIDGEARELDGDCNGTAVRDIGADELPCPPPAPPVPPAATPAPPAVKKKCRKGRKLKRGRCVKKKKKK